METTPEIKIEQVEETSVKTFKVSTPETNGGTFSLHLELDYINKKMKIGNKEYSSKEFVFNNPAVSIVIATLILRASEFAIKELGLATQIINK